MRASLRRVWGMLLRHLYLYRTSWPRLLELAYWPAVQVVLWGFISSFLMTNSTWVAQAAGVLLGGVLLWDTLVRGQLGFAISFMEEQWSRNLAQLFVTPLRPGEFVGAIMLISLLRTLIGMVPATLIAAFLYGYSIYSLGLPLLGFFAVLMLFAWAIGLAVAAMLLRWGLGAESFAWVTIFALTPVSAVFYPVSVLPPALQWVAWSLPTAWVFEGMRAVMIEHRFRFDLLWPALVLNAVYIGTAAGLFMLAFRVARSRGLLLQARE